MPSSVSDDSHLLAGDHVFYGDIPASAKVASPAPAWRAQNGQKIVEVDPAVCDVFHGNTRDLDALEGKRTYEDLRRSIGIIGQTTAAIARVSKDDPSRLEIVAGASRLTAIRDINASDANAGLKLKVELRDLNDAEACKLVEGENAGRAPFSPIEKARFYHSAKPVFGSEAALAEELNLHKSTVGRTLDILRLPTSLMDLVADHHKISAAQADAFMKGWNEPLLQPTLRLAIEQFEGGPASAAAVFKAMKAAIEPATAPTAVRVVLKDGTDIGEARKSQGGGFRIDLRGVDLGDHPYHLINAITTALQQL